MEKISSFIITVLLLTSCSSTNLYFWGNQSNINQHNISPYEDALYEMYTSQTPESYCKMIYVYEVMTSNPGGTRNIIPPGICAEYAFLLLQNDIYNTFAQNAKKSQLKVFGGSVTEEGFTQKAKEMFEMEMKLYPESRTYIEPIYKQQFGGAQ